MTQNELNYMLTIAEHGNLTRAAKELYISQPSLSESLSRIEADLGQPLFVRTINGMVPTEFGFRYLDTARAILNRYRQMESELDEYRQMRRGSLTLGIPSNLGAYLLPMILPSFHTLYPEITVNFRENNSTELDKLMLSGKLDFSIMHDDGAHDGIHYEFLADDPFYLVMPLAAADRLKLPQHCNLNCQDLNVLADEPFLMIAHRQKLRLVVDSILKKLDIKPNIRYTTKNMETAKRLAASGMGITFLPYSYLNLFSSTERLACYPLDQELQASWKLVIGYPKHQVLSRCAQEFINHLKKILLSPCAPAATESPAQSGSGW